MWVRKPCFTSNTSINLFLYMQYESNKMSNLFSFHKKIIQSMSRKGNCWDNVIAESFFKIIKDEWLYRFKFNSFLQLDASLENYLNWFNTQGLHFSFP